jgi:hypothetical protein
MIFVAIGKTIRSQIGYFGCKSLNITKLYILNFFEIWFFDKYREVLKYPDPEGYQVVNYLWIHRIRIHNTGVCVTFFLIPDSSGMLTSFYPEKHFEQNLNVSNKLLVLF